MIGPLAEKARVGLTDADGAAAMLGISRRQVYVLVGRWRAGVGVVSDLLPGRSSGGRGSGRLPDEVEAIVAEVLRRWYLTRQRRSVAAVHREIARQCRLGGLRVPSRGSVVRRIARLEPVSSTVAREGSEAARRLQPPGGVPPAVVDLLEQVQVDHTPVDVIVVDEQHRMPIGRPYLTVAIDVVSRCVVGLVVTLEAPSASRRSRRPTHRPPRRPLRRQDRVRQTPQAARHQPRAARGEDRNPQDLASPLPRGHVLAIAPSGDSQ
ncbi:helix-turn-helix domain-containing protein [Streptomyces yangpuensis]|uniref:Helix-turn-helix domain-containing protein n=1 Tax=Streptomyces yangpuensis TaxID=1648182 RepID=A0ABY5PPN9_9ACTN|nr:DNA-binding domain-containing protein [Streptomyces yangpuensis]UUY45964.1 helix-turn-helix domain-containing protein [Streptomyces yangpuensis]